MNEAINNRKLTRNPIIPLSLNKAMEAVDNELILDERVNTLYKKDENGEVIRICGGEFYTEKFTITPDEWEKSTETDERFKDTYAVDIMIDNIIASDDDCLIEIFYKEKYNLVFDYLQHDGGVKIFVDEIPNYDIVISRIKVILF